MYVCYNEWLSPKNIIKKSSWGDLGEFASVLMLSCCLKINYNVYTKGLKGKLHYIMVSSCYLSCYLLSVGVVLIRKHAETLECTITLLLIFN